MGTRGRRQHDRDLEDGVVGSIGEPNLKRPRVASAVVVPGGGVGGTGGGYGGGEEMGEFVIPPHQTFTEYWSFVYRLSSLYLYSPPKS